MFPIVGIPETIRNGFSPYRGLFCREQGFEHIGRYVTGLLLCPNKTLQGIYDLQVWGVRTVERVVVPCMPLCLKRDGMTTP
jgi:hypothetical protein